MTLEEKQALAKQIGDDAAAKIKVVADKLDAQATEIAKKADSDATKGMVTATDFNTYKETSERLVKEIQEASKQQGVAIAAMQLVAPAETKQMGVGQFLHSKQEQLKAIKNKSNGATVLDFMITADKHGNFHANEIERKDNGVITLKTVGPHATVAGVAGAGNVAAGNVESIFQSLSAGAILRTINDAPMNEQYRNTTWLFGALGLEQVGMENRVAFYFDEQPKTGGSAIVTEGVAKPYAQYAATLKSADYRKRAVALEFTDEFQFDFQFLQTYFLQKARVDLFNDINADVYTRLVAAGIAYAAGDATNFKTANGGVFGSAVNNWDALTALAAKVNKNTFGANANAAIVSTEKNAAMTLVKDTTGQYIPRPEYIKNMHMIENPSVGIDDVTVGDFSQYKLQLRGGLIVRAGLNGNNLIENKMTYVMEQFYFDYISALRAPAILKGTTFAAVKTLLAS